MSIFKDIKELAGGKPQSKDWYRSQLFYGLPDLQTDIKAGLVLFYNYNATTEGLPFFDRYPMTLISGINPATGHFYGGNLHYLRPEVRQGVAKTWGNGGTTYPLRCHHKYLMSNATTIKVVEPIELRDMIPLPLEKFVVNVAGQRLDIPSSFIWSRV
jgi:hypothetical protein|tara:strand:- start:61 stop:531 length:471 start_codon:yes stop_codon:yes gene_type:complete